MVGASNYEDGKTNGGCVRVYDLSRQVAGDSILGPTASTGPLAMADIDDDGDLDLFIGGRVVAGRYPEAADSLLMRNEGGKMVLAQRLEKIGLVSGAVWSDLDGDGRAELVLACEWGPIRVFALEGAKLIERTEKFGFQQQTGWWNGITTGDFDGDGRMDIVASNWGLNSPYRASGEHPCKIYYGDLSGSESVDIIESSFDGKMAAEVPVRGLRAMMMALPMMGERFGSFEAYGKANIHDVLGEGEKQLKVVEARTLATTIFLNRNGHFEAAQLPAEAQWAPAFGICVADFDGDGNDDIYLAQNFFPVHPESSRLDAGRGLCLKGDGKGGFTAWSGQESGIKVYGEQRGCAVADYDGDGRIDLVTTQNGAATRLFHNVKGRPGLRVRFANYNASVGVVMRLVFGEERGPAREVHCGSGYWSQDGAVEVMATPRPATKIWIRWPRGKETTNDIPASAKEILVEASGTVKQVR
jgi:hypothetical protein